MDNLQNLSQVALEYLKAWGPILIYAVLTLVIGLWVIKIIQKAIHRAMTKSNVEISLQKFLLSLANILLKALLVITVLSMLNVQMTSFVAILGAAGLAVGLALQGGLANFAGGVLILLFKPFKVGDFIEAQGYLGVVNEIQVFNTILKTGDNKTIIIPNGALSNGNITNYSTEPRRRVDMTFGIGYSDDLKKAKQLITKLVEGDSRILQEPAPFIAVSELADSSVNFVVRAWVNSGDYWGVFFDMQENIKLTFDKEGISIPFPQQDVHVYKHES